MGTAIGEESFTDINGNGFYDSGESFVNLGEPFRDDNENGLYSSGEYFLDFNHDGVRNVPDRTLQGNHLHRQHPDFDVFDRHAWDQRS